ncbi:hypothetical protein [Aeromicrobium wangtongii]|uniref:hypothetical protein n=1 Tax=Aeromicrobium wangtongii TaxID=2969247 RepID=UPI002017278B|nr:hypothetical protein [Aeromicrobium wangtongii]MCL3818262.1 hypothetical protein [Aeromicrobium wangtongii]
MKPFIVALAVIAAIGVSSAVVVAAANDEQAVAQDDLAEQVAARAEQLRGGDAMGRDERSIVEASRTSTRAPRSFREREKLPICGEIVLTSVTGVDPRAFECLVSPGAAGAELIVLRRTNEGDPIVRYYRVGGSGENIEVFGDDTLDKFGMTGWTRQVTTLDRLAKLGL